MSCGENLLLLGHCRLLLGCLSLLWGCNLEEESVSSGWAKQHEITSYQEMKRDDKQETYQNIK